MIQEMDSQYKEIWIKQENCENDEIDRGLPYTQEDPNYDDSFNPIKIKEEKITQYYDDSPIEGEVENSQVPSFVDINNLPDTVDAWIKSENITNEACDLLLRRMNDEKCIYNDGSSDSKECIKMEEDMLAVDEQECENDSTKTEELAEELDIKPDVSNNENRDGQSDRVVRKRNIGNQDGAIDSKSDKDTFICYSCNFIVKSKKDLIDHFNVEDCRVKRSMKDILFVRKILLQSDEYVCKKCHNIYKSKSDFDDHVAKEHADLISSDVARHLKKHSVKRRPCNHCDKAYKTKKALDDHIIKKHEEFISSISYKVHKCSYCSFKTALQMHLASHMSKHPESGCTVKERKRQELQCIHCSRKFLGKKSLYDHIIKKHEEFIASVSYKIHQCELCSYKTAMSSHFDRHMKRHTKLEFIDPSAVKLKEVEVKKRPPAFKLDAKPIQCSYCDKTFKGKQAHDDHVIKKHEEFIASISSKVHPCTHCSYKTTKPSTLAEHITSKHPETGFIRNVKRRHCIHCDKTFRTTASLSDHLIKNHQESVASVSSKVHQCDYCSYKTTNRSNLVKHLARHLGGERDVKQFLCTHCDMTFKSKRALDGHIVKNHKEFIVSVTNKIHECQHCSYTTINKDHLAIHLSKYHDTASAVQ